MRAALRQILEDGDNALPALVREVYADLQERLRGCDQRIGEMTVASVRGASSERAQRLMRVERVGLLTATALLATAAMVASSVTPPVCCLVGPGGAATLLGRQGAPRAEQET